MFSCFRTLALVCFVLGPIAGAYGMEYDRLQEAVRIGTLKAMGEADPSLRGKAEGEENEHCRKAYEQEKRFDSDWQYIEQLPSFARHPFRLDFGWRMPKRLEKLREFNSLPAERRQKLVQEAREEIERCKNQEKRQEENGRLLDKSRRDSEQLRLKNRNCAEVLYEDYVRDCSCCWDKRGCGCTPWCLIPALLCCPTLGFGCTTSVDDCCRGDFCQRCCCWVEVCEDCCGDCG